MVTSGKLLTVDFQITGDFKFPEEVFCPPGGPETTGIFFSL